MVRLEVSGIGKWLIGIGTFFLLAGLILIGLERVGIRGWHLPGDIAYERAGFRFYFPLGTSLLLSLVLTLILTLAAWLIRIANR